MRAASRGFYAQRLLLGLEPSGLSPAPGADYCLSLPGSSEMGLTSGNHFSFFGKFLSRYTHVPCNWWVWKRGEFPKKGKELSQTQAEVRWARGSLTDKWEPEQFGWAAGFSGANGVKNLKTQTAPSLLCCCFFFCNLPILYQILPPLFELLGTDVKLRY